MKLPRTSSVLSVTVLCVLGACTQQPEEPWGVTMLATPALPGSGQAHLAGGARTALVLSWQEPGSQGGSTLRTATFDGEQWVPSADVASGNNWFVNWADFPSVVPLRPQLSVAHWLELKPEQRYAYDIRYALSEDGGRTWTDAGVLNADTAIAEHGFVSFFEWGEQVGAIWLDGRRVAALTIDELFELEEPVGMTLRFARFDSHGVVSQRGEIDELVCDCCQTDAVTTPDGPVIVYRDRTTDEVRDIAVRRAELPESASGAAAWSEPIVLGPDNWVIDGCPVNGPALAAADDHLGVAWFTAADNRPGIRFARSHDRGRTFDAAQNVATDGALGQVDIVMLADGTAFISAWHRAEAGMELRVHRVAAGDDAIDVRTIAHSDSSLPTDVPQMALDGDRLVFAWSELADPGRLYSAAAPLW